MGLAPSIGANCSRCRDMPASTMTVSSSASRHEMGNQKPNPFVFVVLTEARIEKTPRHHTRSHIAVSDDRQGSDDSRA
jgi:hypothetical protein